MLLCRSELARDQKRSDREQARCHTQSRHRRGRRLIRHRWHARLGGLVWHAGFYRVTRHAIGLQANSVEYLGMTAKSIPHVVDPPLLNRDPTGFDPVSLSVEA